MDIVSIYTDGSFSHTKKLTAWAYAVIGEKEKVVFSKSGVISGKITDMCQVGGEMQAIMSALSFCKENNFKCNIYYDFNNLYYWIADLFGESRWKTNNEHTKFYRDFVISHKDYLNKMIKVKGHSGNKFNDLVDKLVGETLEKYE